MGQGKCDLCREKFTHRYNENTVFQNCEADRLTKTMAYLLKSYSDFNRQLKGTIGVYKDSIASLPKKIINLLTLNLSGVWI